MALGIIMLFVAVVCLFIIIARRSSSPAIVERRESSRAVRKAVLRSLCHNRRVIGVCHGRALVICKEGGSVESILRQETRTFFTFTLPEDVTLVCCMYLRLFTIVNKRTGEKLAAVRREDYPSLLAFREACINAFEEVVSLPVTALYY